MSRDSHSGPGSKIRRMYPRTRDVSHGRSGLWSQSYQSRVRDHCRRVRQGKRILDRRQGYQTEASGTTYPAYRIAYSRHVPLRRRYPHTSPSNMKTLSHLTSIDPQDLLAQLRRPPVKLPVLSATPCSHCKRQPTSQSYPYAQSTSESKSKTV